MDDQSKCLEGPLDGQVKLLESLLQVEQVSKEFRMNDGTKFAALRGFSLEICNIEHKPQIVSLLGPSGAGKAARRGGQDRRCDGDRVRTRCC